MGKRKRLKPHMVAFENQPVRTLDHALAFLPPLSRFAAAVSPGGVPGRTAAG